MNDTRGRHSFRYVWLAAALLLLPPVVSAAAQTRRQSGKRFKVAYSLKSSQGGPAEETYDGYLSVLTGGFQFRGRRYEHERVKARSGGPAYAETFTCSEVSNLQFRPSYSAVDLEVRGRPRFIYCPREFEGLRAAITRLCGAR